VKELPRLRAPRSVAEGVSREIQAAGKVHSFAKMRRTVLWASAAAAALFIGLNVMYFGASKEMSAPTLAKEPTSNAPAVLGRVQQQHQEEAQNAGEKDAVARRGSAAPADRAADEDKLREARKSVVEQKELHARDDAAKKAAEPAPVERARAKEKADGLAKADGAARGAAPAEPAPVTAAPKPTAPPGAAPPPAPTAKSAATPPAPEAAEKAMPKKDENLARSEAELKGGKRFAGNDNAAEAGPTHLTLAATQLSKSRPQVEEALRKMGVTLPQAAPPVKNMKAQPTRETETAIPLELTDSQIARLRQELDKPGASRLLSAAPGDPVLAEFRDGRMFGTKKESGAATGGGATAQGVKPKDAPKPDAKVESKDAKESKEAEAPARALAEGLADKSNEPRRRVILHLIEVPYVPEVQPAAESIKK
jgi:hypothetical protein